MDFFGFKRRRQRAELIEKLFELAAMFQEEYDEARDAFNDLASEVTAREDYEERDSSGDNDWDDELEELANRSYAAMTKLELIQGRLEALEAE